MFRVDQNATPLADICLAFASISAVNDGYEVQAVLDASGSSFELQEDTARRRMEHAGVVLTATNTIIAELVQNWATRQAALSFLMSWRRLPCSLQLFSKNAQD